MSGPLMLPPLLRRSNAYGDLEEYAPIVSEVYVPPIISNSIDFVLNTDEYKVAEMCLKIRENSFPYEMKAGSMSYGSVFINASDCFSLCAKFSDIKSQEITISEAKMFFNNWDRYTDHEFLVIEMEKKFIVDLMLWHLIDDKLMLKDDEKIVVDHMLKYGFVELIDDNLDVYQRLLQGVKYHETQPHNYWKLPIKQII